MSGIQTIIDNATFITIDDQRITGSSISRSGQYKTAERGPSPYSFSVGMHQGLTYSTNRALLSELSTLGKTVEANVSLNNNTNMNYLTAYQGDIDQAQLNNITVNSVFGSEIYVNCSSATGSGTLFKKGDYLQPKGNTNTYRYPYQVTSDVTFSTGANVTIPVSRPVLSQSGVAIPSNGIKVGNDVTFHVKCVNQPNYSIVPHDLISFSDNFNLIEVIT